MAVATGIAPRELEGLDGDTWLAMQEAIENRWTDELELAATLAEIAHAHLLLFARANFKKPRLPEPLQVKRRGQAQELPRPEPVRIGALAQIGGRGVELKAVPRAG